MTDGIPQPFRVLRTRRESEDVFSLWLESKKTAPQFSPGQFNMLYAFGMGEVPISISGAETRPNQHSTWIHTIRAVGPTTQALKKLKAGSVLGVRGPFGNSWPLEKAQGQDTLIFAGGIGLAPLRPALIELIFGKIRPKKISLIYGVRTPKDILFLKELNTWQKRKGFELHITVDRPVQGWRGHVGVVTELIPQIRFQPNQCLALLCGPEVMMRFTIQELKKLGLRDQAIYLSMERNMKCAMGFCGRCQFVPYFLCQDGPIFSYSQIQYFFGRKEL